MSGIMWLLNSFWIWTIEVLFGTNWIADLKVLVFAFTKRFWIYSLVLWIFSNKHLKYLYYWRLRVDELKKYENVFERNFKSCKVLKLEQIHWLDQSWIEKRLYFISLLTIYYLSNWFIHYYMCVCVCVKMILNFT